MRNCQLQQNYRRTSRAWGPGIISELSVSQDVIQRVGRWWINIPHTHKGCFKIHHSKLDACFREEDEEGKKKGQQLSARVQETKTVGTL